MTIFKAYFGGLKETVKLPATVFILWIINALLAALVALPLFGALDAQIGNSVSAEKLLQGFSATVWSDMSLELESSLKMFLSQVKWLIFIYLLVNIFFAGGIIQTLNQDKFSLNSFFAGSGINFFRFLGISTIMFVIQIITAVIIWLPAAIVLYNLSDSGATENSYMNVIFVAGGIHILLIMMLFMISDYAKFHAALYNTQNFFKSVGGGFRYVFKNFGRTSGLYLMLVILPIGLTIGYFYADTQINTSFKEGVFVMVVLQQLFMILRIWFRIWIFASPLQMYTEDFLHDNKVLKSLALMNEWQKKALASMKQLENQSEAEIQPKKEIILTEAEILARIAESEILEAEAQIETVQIPELENSETSDEILNEESSENELIENDILETDNLWETEKSENSVVNNHSESIDNQINNENINSSEKLNEPENSVEFELTELQIKESDEILIGETLENEELFSTEELEIQVIDSENTTISEQEIITEAPKFQLTKKKSASETSKFSTNDILSSLKHIEDQLHSHFPENIEESNDDDKIQTEISNPHTLIHIQNETDSDIAQG